MFKAGRQHLKDAAKRTSESARRVAASSREQYERVKADLAEAVRDAVMDPVIKFHGRSAHDDFVRWIRENPNGFVINSVSSVNFMLHRADCPHFVFHKPRYCLTTNMKVCSLRRDRLERWARWQFFTDLHSCSDCAI